MSYDEAKALYDRLVQELGPDHRVSIQHRVTMGTTTCYEVVISKVPAPRDTRPYAEHFFPRWKD